MNVLARMGLQPEQGRRFPHELSGGEIQRALLAMALIMDPAVLILDEPTSALDAMTKSFVAHVIQDVSKKGASVLLVTHDLDLADKLADDLAVLYLGQIMETMPAARPSPEPVPSLHPGPGPVLSGHGYAARSRRYPRGCLLPGQPQTFPRKR